MTEDDKNILFGDLFARIRHGVLVDGGSEYGVCTLVGFEYYVFLAETSYQLEVGLECPRPYLRPMSSMTEEEKLKLENMEFEIAHLKFTTYAHECMILDYLYSRHLDVRGLIPIGLALEAPEGMYKTE